MLSLSFEGTTLERLFSMPSMGSWTPGVRMLMEPWPWSFFWISSAETSIEELLHVGLKMQRHFRSVWIAFVVEQMKVLHCSSRFHRPELKLVPRAMLYMPLVHAENLELQQLSVGNNADLLNWRDEKNTPNWLTLPRKLAASHCKFLKDSSRSLESIIRQSWHLADILREMCTSIEHRPPKKWLIWKDDKNDIVKKFWHHRSEKKLHLFSRFFSKFFRIVQFLFQTLTNCWIRIFSEFSRVFDPLHDLFFFFRGHLCRQNFQLEFKLNTPLVPD